MRSGRWNGGQRASGENISSMQLGCRLLAALGLVLSAGCGGEESPDDGSADGKGDVAAGEGVGDSAGDGAVSADGTDADGGGGVDATIELPKEDFWVLYGRSCRTTSCQDINDLVLTNKDNAGALTLASKFGIGVHPTKPTERAPLLTKIALKNSGGLTCQFGCTLSDNLKWIAVAVGQPSSKGFTYQLGLLNEKLEAFIGKFGKLEDVADLHFVGNKLFYSKARNCFQTQKCQYEVRVRSMDGTVEDKVLTVMAPDNDPDVQDTTPHTTYTGRFQVSDDGETLVFLTPTIRSVKVWAWRGGNLTQLDYICEHPLDNNTCVGTGSQYHDDDEVGISPDGKTIVLFTIVDRSLRVRRYQLESTQAAVFSNLVTVPAGGAYLQTVCLNQALLVDRHAEVRDRPWFSADGARVYFRGRSACTGSKDKEWTDLMSMEVAKIGGPIVAGDITNHTLNPRENVVSNLWIHDFAMSPDRKFFVFSASPLWSTSPGEPATGQRMIADREAYVMPANVPRCQSKDGETECAAAKSNVPGVRPVQITNEVSYDAYASRGIRPVPLQ